MPLTREQADALYQTIRSAIDGAPGIIQPFLPSILRRVDGAIPDLPPSLRTASVGDVLDAYLHWRKAGQI